MELTVVFNDEVRTYESISVALGSLQEGTVFRWGLPPARAFEKGANVPVSFSMPSLYDSEGNLVTTSPVKALLVLIGAHARDISGEVKVSIQNASDPDLDRLDGVLEDGKIAWTDPMNNHQFMEPKDILQMLEADRQIAEHQASRARLIRDIMITSFVSNETLTAYRVAKYLKITAPAVAQIRARVQNLSGEEQLNIIAGANID